jgi:enoyl-CoA hydratase/carnithine racemase
VHVFWELEQREKVVIATFTRPPRNMMSFEAMTELEGLTKRVAADSSVAVLVVTGGLPGYFVAHADLEDLVAFGQGREVTGDPGSWARALALFEEMPQPVVAAINGQAWGGGCELALACTLRVMAESAHIAQPEVNVGIIPGAGGTQRLPRLIGVGSAADLVLSGRAMSGEEARACGYAQAVFPDDDFMERVLEWVARIAAKPQTALAAAKRSLIEGVRLPISEGLRLEGQLFVQLQRGEEAIGLETEALARYATAGPNERVEL